MHGLPARFGTESREDVQSSCLPFRATRNIRRQTTGKKEAVKKLP